MRVLARVLRPRPRLRVRGQMAGGGPNSTTLGAAALGPAGRHPADTHTGPQQAVQHSLRSCTGCTGLSGRYFPPSPLPPGAGGSWLHCAHAALAMPRTPTLTGQPLNLLGVRGNEGKSPGPLAQGPTHRPPAGMRMPRPPLCRDSERTRATPLLIAHTTRMREARRNSCDEVLRRDAATMRAMRPIAACAPCNPRLAQSRARAELCCYVTQSNASEPPSQPPTI